MSITGVSTSGRYAHFDALRSGLFSLGLFLHAAWLCKHLNGSYKIVFDVIHSFRMEVFFWIAGFLAARSLATRGAKDFLVSRVQRLGIPLAFCFLLFSFIDQMVGQRGWNDIIHSSAVAGEPIMELTGHLWFLRALLCLTITLAILHHYRWSRHGIDGFIHTRISPVFLICLVTLANYVAPRIMRTIPHGTWSWPHLSGDLENVFRYGVWFGTGYCLYLRQEILDVLSEWRLFNLANLLVFPLAFRWLEDSPVGHFAVRIWQGVWLISVCVLLIGWSKRLFRNDTPRLRMFAGAGYTIYLLHWPLMALIFEYATPMSWPPMAIFVWLVCTAGSISYAAHRYVVLKSPLAACILNGAPFGTRVRPATSALGGVTPAH